jgi:hypothetical protein
VSQEEPDKLSASNGIWHELRFVAPIATEPAASTVESLISGESVIVVPDLVSDAECAALSDEALQAVVKASLVPKCVRLPLMVKSQSRDDVASKGHKQEWSLESRPDQAGSETVTAALTVAADTMDEQFPSVARDVFGAGKGAAANLVQMYDEDDLEYASYEPAVNVSLVQSVKPTPRAVTHASGCSDGWPSPAESSATHRSTAPAASLSRTRTTTALRCWSRCPRLTRSAVVARASGRAKTRRMSCRSPPTFESTPPLLAGKRHHSHRPPALDCNVVSCRSLPSW